MVAVVAGQAQAQEYMGMPIWIALDEIGIGDESRKNPLPDRKLR
jgi:hypothetical protein